MREVVEDLFENFSDQNLKVLCERLTVDLPKINGVWHPLGFAIVKLFESDQFKYRLHIWPAGERKPKYPDWPIHSHRFDLESLVIAGKIGSKNYLVQESKDENPSQYLKYEVQYNSNGSEIISTSCFLDVIPDTEQWSNKGDIYKIKRGAFHQSCVAKNDFSASLVRTSNEDINLAPIVVGFNDFDRMYDCHDSRLSSVRLADLITCIR